MIPAGGYSTVRASELYVLCLVAGLANRDIHERKLNVTRQFAKRRT
jgi:hypothetical protein